MSIIGSHASGRSMSLIGWEAHELRIANSVWLGVGHFQPSTTRQLN